MQVDFKELKRIVDETILTEAKCILLMHSILDKENQGLHNSTLDKIISVLSKWATTPPIEILRELDDLQGEDKLT